jgi:hypothetical protein
LDFVPGFEDLRIMVQRPKSKDQSPKTKNPPRREINPANE